MRLFVLLDDSCQIKEADVRNWVKPKATPENFALLTLNGDCFPPRREQKCSKEIKNLLDAEVRRIFERYNASRCIVIFGVEDYSTGIRVPIECAFVADRDGRSSEVVLNPESSNRGYVACPASRDEALIKVKTLLGLELCGV